jgi:hypothetical protein
MKLRTLRFYGHSDDTFGYEEIVDGSDRGDDHDNCNNGSLMAFKITSKDEGMIVTGQYAPSPIPDGTWVVGITLLKEDSPLPNWPMKWGTSDLVYSPSLILEAPDDAVIEDITNSGHED